MDGFTRSNVETPTTVNTFSYFLRSPNVGGVTHDENEIMKLLFIKYEIHTLVLILL